MKNIKLLKIGELENGVQRFQSQLFVGTNTADFIMEDKIMKNWGSGDKGFNFYFYNGNYEIVSSKSDMFMQPL